MKNKKVLLWGMGVLMMFMLSVFLVSAAEFRVGKDGGGVTIGAGETVKNLYTAGNIVLINGNVEKNLYAGGNVITVTGNVGQGVYIGGSSVNINGNVGGSVHVAGGNIVVDGVITDDLFLAGGNIVISKSASVGGDLYVAGGTVDVQGYVAGEVNIAGGAVVISGKVDGPVDIKAEELKIGSSAEIMQNLKYTSPKEAEIKDGAQVLGAVEFIKKDVRGAGKSYAIKMLLGIFTTIFLIKLLSLIVAGLVMVYLLPKITEPVIQNSFKNFWVSLGLGFAVLFLIPVLAIILAVSVIGLWLAGLIFILYLMMVMLASVFTSVAFGSWLVKVSGKNRKFEISWQQVVYGTVALSVVCLIPVLGWLVCFVFFLISLGSVSQLVHQSHFKK